MRPRLVGARSRRTNANDARQTKRGARRQRRVAARPVRARALGRPEDPERREHHATANFIAFSGTRASGACTAMPVAATSTDGGRGAHRGERDRSLALPEGEDDERHLEPFEEDALEGERETICVEGRRAPCSPRLERWRARARRSRPRRGAPSGRSARRIAFRSHCQAEDEQEGTGRRAGGCRVGSRSSLGRERRADRRERHDRGTRPAREGAPARARARGEDDCQRLDHLDRTRQERGEDEEDGGSIESFEDTAFGIWVTIPSRG